MFRYITLQKPIRYTKLNGQRIKYNSLQVYYEKNGYVKVLLSHTDGCAHYNEIELTDRKIKAPAGYVALRPNTPSAHTVIPQLEKQGVIIPHKKKTLRYTGFVDYLIYKLNFTSIDVNPEHKNEKMLIQT